jgi:hypothetical protein
VIVARTPRWENFSLASERASGRPPPRPGR